MIFEWKFGGHVIKVCRGICIPLFVAEVVDLVVAVVIELEKRLDIGDGVSIDAFNGGGRKPHRDDRGRDVRKVQIEPVLLEAELVFRHQRLEQVGRAFGLSFYHFWDFYAAGSS